MGSFHAPRSVRPSTGGFTLIEMLIVLTIIVIVTAIAIGGQSNFNRTLTLNNAAYSIALSLREAQTYGLSSRTYTGIRNTGYGVNFTMGAPTAYTLFADTCTPVASDAKPDVKPGNNRYDPTPLTGCTGTERVSSYALNNGFTVSKICSQTIGGTWYCSTDGTPVTALDVVFARPEATATISALRGTYMSGYTRACVSLQSPLGDTRSVFVSETGQVSVSNNACPS